MPSSDLKSKAKGHKNKLLSDGDARDIVLSILERSIEYAKQYDKQVTTKKWRFGFVNYNFARWYNIKDKGIVQDAHKKAKKRIYSYIKQLKPDAIVVLGHRAANSLSDGKIKIENGGSLFSIMGIPAVSSIDAEHVNKYDIEGNTSNLAGRIIRETANIFIGRMPHELSYIEPEYRLVDTPKKFNGMIEGTIWC